MLPFRKISPAIIANGFVYTWGCLGYNAKLQKVEGGAGPETKQALENMLTILEAAGSSVEKVVKMTIFITDQQDFAAVNAEYKKGMANAFLRRRWTNRAVGDSGFRIKMIGVYVYFLFKEKFLIKNAQKDFCFDTVPSTTQSC